MKGKELKRMKILMDMLEEEEKVEEGVVNAVEFGRNAPLPAPEQAYEDVYA